MKAYKLSIDEGESRYVECVCVCVCALSACVCMCVCAMSAGVCMCVCIECVSHPHRLHR